MKIVKLPQLEWYDRKDLEINLPDSWDIHIANFTGYNKPALNQKQIQDVIAYPTCMVPLRQAAKGKKEAVILFDDITRGTQPANIVPFILKELSIAGIPDKNIRFICALGAHAPMDRIHLVKKLGEDIVDRYAVFNHNPFDSCVYVGTTSYGTRVSLNAEFMQCDFKIIIASMVPHPFAVFGGGGKMILPGISSMETMMVNHSLPLNKAEREHYEINKRRLDMEEASGFAGTDMLVQCLVNMWGETCSLYAGKPDAVREQAVKEAKLHYQTDKITDSDIVILNAYFKANEAGVTMRIAMPLISKQGGSVVLVANAPGGQVLHYLMGNWGIFDNESNRKYKIPRSHGKNNNIKQVIAYSEYSTGRSLPENNTVKVNNWPDALKLLQQSYPGKARVAIYPNADIAYFPPLD